jgi:hypothetical protein
VEPKHKVLSAKIGPLIADADAGSISRGNRFIATGAIEMANMIESRLPFEPCGLSMPRSTVLLFAKSLDTQGIQARSPRVHPDTAPPV